MQLGAPPPAAAADPVPFIVTIAVASTNGASIFAMLAVLGVVFAHRSLQRHPASLVVARCAADLLFCGCQLASHLAPAASCEAWSFSAQTLAMAAELYTLL